MSPGAPSVRINGRPTCITDDLVSRHFPCPLIPIHCKAVTTKGSRSVRAEGKPIVYEGSPDSCKTHSRASGSRNVIVGT